jgi:acetoin utilization protein AcuB
LRSASVCDRIFLDITTRPVADPARGRPDREVTTMRPRSNNQHLIRDFMSPTPHSIGRHQPLAVAHERMRASGIRHLPVLEGGKLVGLLSQRDAFFIETLRDVDPASVPVEDAMSVDVYITSPDAPLSDVAATMAEHKYGCAVVMDGAHLTGIFTTVDALIALARIAGHSRRE